MNQKILNMTKFIIDTGKLSNNKKQLLNILNKFKLVIFDLDDTIFPLYCYDIIVFRNLIKKISQKNKINKKKAFNYLVTEKHFKKSKQKLFSIFLKKFNLVNKVSEKSLVNFYQNHSIIKNFRPPSLKNLIKNLKKKNIKLLLITEGYMKRQNNKIKSLGIENLFDYKIILDGKNNRKYKPSVVGLKKYLKIIKKNNTIYLGDSKKDKQISKKLNISFYYFNISKLIREFG